MDCRQHDEKLGILLVEIREVRCVESHPLYYTVRILIFLQVQGTCFTVGCGGEAGDFLLSAKVHLFIFIKLFFFIYLNSRDIYARAPLARIKCTCVWPLWI